VNRKIGDYNDPGRTCNRIRLAIDAGGSREGYERVRSPGPLRGAVTFP